MVVAAAAAAAAAAAVVVDLNRWCVSVLLVVVALASAVLVLLTVHGCQVLIYFSDKQCVTYYNAVNKFAFVVNWCYNGTAPAEGLPAEWVRMVSSHRPLWQAVGDYIRTRGVQPPMRTTQSSGAVHVRHWKVRRGCLNRNAESPVPQPQAQVRSLRLPSCMCAFSSPPVALVV